PVLGSGVGSYEVAIHETQDARNPDELIYAHSEPLHMLAEGGVVGFFLCVLLAAGVARGALRAANSDDSSDRMLACGCGAALAALLAGCTTEFHLHIPALGIAAAVIAAIPAALLTPEPEILEGASPRWLLPTAAALVVAAALAAGDGSSAASMRGEAMRAEQRKANPDWERSALEWTRRAPRDAAAWRSRAMALLEDGAPGPLAERAERSLAAADRAVHLEPFHPYGHWTRAVALLALERQPDAVPAMTNAISRAGGIGHLHLAVGSVLLHLSTEQPDLRPLAIDILREAGRIHPWHHSAAVKLATDLGIPESERAGLAPRR
ncbi:MAG TPA: O-antigen ligase family protein, partial [Planctomycetota bacterium]|nr:O-antigen ligase family protein [Planctomycetota bacterium]